ncbi:MAG: SDR family NAD(P)-dependent oxidoreductase [Polyangiales bacterium]|jgi:NAD(P)-dependent dehydrogenase (short-subunit alcohol dehydrogenase family)
MGRQSANGDEMNGDSWVGSLPSSEASAATDALSTPIPDFPEGVALIVGGSGGIGSAVARAFAVAGVPLAITFHHNEQAAEAVAGDIRNGGGLCSVHRVALDEPDAVKACIDELAAACGPLHTIVHAAGTHIDQPYISQLEPEQWRNTMDWDVNGFFHLVHTALPHLRKSRGSIVFISSAGLKRFPPGDVLSVAPKAAIEALMRGIAREEGRYGVRANSVAVGVVDAGMFPKLVERGELSQEWIDAALRNTPLRRFGTPEEIAHATVFLASSRARYITGQTLFVDGGYTL